MASGTAARKVRPKYLGRFALTILRVIGAPGQIRTADLLVRSQGTSLKSLIIEQIFMQENSI